MNITVKTVAQRVVIEDEIEIRALIRVCEYAKEHMDLLSLNGTQDDYAGLLIKSVLRDVSL